MTTRPIHNAESTPPVVAGMLAEFDGPEALKAAAAQRARRRAIAAGTPTARFPSTASSGRWASGRRMLPWLVLGGGIAGGVGRAADAVVDQRRRLSATDQRQAAVQPAGQHPGHVRADRAVQRAGGVRRRAGAEPAAAVLPSACSAASGSAARRPTGSSSSIEAADAKFDEAARPRVACSRPGPRPSRCCRRQHGEAASSPRGSTRRASWRSCSGCCRRCGSRGIGRARNRCRGSTSFPTWTSSRSTSRRRPARCSPTAAPCARRCRARSSGAACERRAFLPRPGRRQAGRDVPHARHRRADAARPAAVRHLLRHLPRPGGRRGRTGLTSLRAGRREDPDWVLPLSLHDRRRARAAGRADCSTRSPTASARCPAYASQIPVARPLGDHALRAGTAAEPERRARRRAGERRDRNCDSSMPTDHAAQHERSPARRHVQLSPPAMRLAARARAARLVAVGAIVGVAALAAAALARLGAATTIGGTSCTPIWSSFCFFSSMSLGALFFVLLQHATRAGWSVTVRRLAEILAANVPPAGRAVPADPRAVLWRQPRRCTTGPIRTQSPHDPLLQHKARVPEPAVLRAPRGGLLRRLGGCLARFFLRRSREQDGSGDPALTAAHGTAQPAGAAALRRHGHLRRRSTG